MKKKARSAAAVKSIEKQFGKEFAQATKVVIAQTELMELETLRLDRQRAAKQERELKARIDAREAELIAKLKGGAVVEGRLNAAVEREQGDCRPPWKDCYLDHMAMEHGQPRESIEEQTRLAFPGGFKDVLVITPRAAEPKKKSDRGPRELEKLLSFK